MSLALVGLGAQAALGLGQTIAGAFKKKPIIPEADIPDEVFQNMTDAEYWSYIGMPATQQQRYIENIQRARGAALEGARDRKSGMGMVSRIQQGETEGYRDVAEMDTNLRFQNINRLYAARDRVTQQDNRADDINRGIKLDERGRRDNLIGAGLQNTMGALGTMGTMAAMFPENMPQWGKKTGNEKNTDVDGWTPENVGAGGSTYEFLS